MIFLLCGSHLCLKGEALILGDLQLWRGREGEREGDGEGGREEEGREERGGREGGREGERERGREGGRRKGGRWEEHATDQAP